VSYREPLQEQTSTFVFSGVSGFVPRGLPAQEEFSTGSADGTVDKRWGLFKRPRSARENQDRVLPEHGSSPDLITGSDGKEPYWS